MNDLAHVGFEVDSTALRRGTTDVHKFGEEGVRTDRKIKGATTGINKSFGSVNAMLTKLTRVAGGAFVALAAGASIGAAMTAARQYGSALAEVSTLIENTAEQSKFLEGETRRLAATYGGTGTSQAKAFYQAISAGAATVEDAAKTVEAANRLAIGGVTDVTTATDILTTAMNVYKAQGLSATEVSDAMFVAMKAGKTTVGELASSLGKVLPLSEKMGLSFDETAAAVAALTKGGISTAESVTGLRAALTAALGPSKQATDLAKQLGLDFSAAGVEANGFAGFMAEVVQKTGGSAELMQQLFGSVEAVGAALAFSGEAGVSMSQILDDMSVKSGATDAAFNKIALSLDQRLNVAMGKLDGYMTSVGNVALQIFVPALEGAIAAGEALAANLDILVIALSGIAATQAPAALAAIGSGFVAAGGMAGVFTTAVTVARAALIALGGPLGLVYGILGASAAAWLVWKGGANDGETASYDAAAGTAALMGQLDAFSASAAPTAAAKAIDLANANHELAASAYSAAKAELAKRRALLDMREASGVNGTTGSIKDTGITETVRTVTAAEKELIAAEKSLEQAIQDRNLAARHVTGTMSEVMSATHAAAAANRDATVTLDINTDGLGANTGAKNKNTKATKGASDAAKKAAKSAKDMADEIERLEFDADPIKKYNKELDNLNELVKNGLSDGAYAHAVQDLNDEFVNSYPNIAKVADAIGDFVAGGLRDFDSLLDGFKNMLRQMIASAIANPIKLALVGGMSGGGMAGTAAQAAAAPGGGLLSGGGLLGGIGGKLLGGFGNSGSILGLGGLGGGTGFLGGLGNAVSGGLGNIFSVGANAAAAGGGLAASIGAVVPVLGIAAAAFSFFRTKTKELDRGLRVTVEGMETLVETFKKVEKKKFWGLSKKVSTSYKTAADEVASPLIDAVRGMGDNVLGLAQQLGASSDALDNFSGSIKVSTKGLSDEEAQKKIAEAVGDFANDMVTEIFGGFSEAVTKNIFGIETVVKERSGQLSAQFEALQKTGEEAIDTLSRLVTNMNAVNEAMDTLGHHMYATSLDGAAAASELVDAFGGLDAFTNATTAFFQGFFSQEERFETALRQIEERFADIGRAVPQTREEFRKLVDSLDTSTAYGRKLYAELVLMSGALSDVLPSVSNFTREIAQMVGSISSELDAVISDTSAAMQANQQAAAQWYRTAQTLRDFVADMRGTAGALVSTAQAQQNNEARFQSLLTSAVAGDSQAATSLPNAARALLETTKLTARSALEQARIEARVLSDLKLASGVADVEGARHDVIAGLMGQQVEILEQVRDSINSGEPLEPEHIDKLNKQLGDLEGAIAAAEMINYAFLKERLDVTVDLLATADLPADVRRLLANAQDGIEGTIDFIVRSDLTPDQKWLALTGASEHIKTIELALASGSDAAAVRAAMLAEGYNRAIRNVIVDFQYDRSVSTAQKRLLDILGADSAGRITLGGTFKFDPTTGFQTWYSTATKTNISNPISALRKNLDALTSAVRKETARQEAAAAAAQKISGLQTQLGQANYRRESQISQAHSLIAQIKELENRFGVQLMNGKNDAVLQVNAQGGVDYQATHLKVPSGGQAGKFGAEFWGPGGLQQQLNQIGQKPVQELAKIEQLRRQIVSLGAVPAFAMGGQHRGGMARVGENDIELVAPSRIYNPADTRRMLDNQPVIEAIRILASEVDRLRDENSQLLTNIASDTRKTRFLEERREELGTATYTVPAPEGTPV